jgi:hypothetical protein
LHYEWQPRRLDHPGDRRREMAGEGIRPRPGRLPPLSGEPQSEGLLDSSGYVVGITPRLGLLLRFALRISLASIPIGPLPPPRSAPALLRPRTAVSAAVSAERARTDALRTQATDAETAAKQAARAA